MTLPLNILIDPSLTDCDIRVLLVLDQLAWREGDRDGTVRLSNREIGDKIKKSEATIRTSLRKFERLDPPLVVREMLTDNRRDGIRICYDRFGEASTSYPNMTNRQGAGDIEGVARISPTPLQPESEPGEILATPIQPHPEMVEKVPIAYDQESVADPADSQGVARILTPSPYRELDVVVAVVGGSGRRISPTPLEAGEPDDLSPSPPRSLPELLAWVPSVTDHEKDQERLRKKIPHWIQQIRDHCPEHSPEAIRWIQDAILAASEKDDIVRYAAKMLGVYAGQGGSFKVLPAPILTPEDLGDMPAMRAFPVPPKANGYGHRPSKADRDALAAAERDELFGSLFPAKEARHGAR